MKLLGKGVRPVQMSETCPISKSHARVSSRDAEMHHFFAKYQDTGSHEHALKLQAELSHRMTIDHTFKQFELQLELGEEPSEGVYDSECLKAAVGHFEQKCGKFSDYSLKYVMKLAKACEKEIPYDIIFHTIQGLSC